MTENKDRFKIVYEGSGAKLLFDDAPLCFLTKSKNDHLKLTSKRSKFYNNLKDIGQQDVFSIELANELRSEIDKVFTSITIAKQPKKQDVVKPNLDIKTWEQLKLIININLHKRDKEFKYLLACIISIWFRQNDFIFSLMVAERGDAKSTMLKAFNDSLLTFSVDTFTANAFAPGTASIGENPFSLLEDCIDKTLLVHDMSASLSLPNEVKMKILGDITNSYDEDGLLKYSPGAGNKRYGGAYNFIGGITYRFLRNNWSLISNTGRFLYYKMRGVDFEEIIHSKKIPNKTELNAAVKGFICNLIEQRKELIRDNKWNRILIHPSSVDYMIDFFKVYKKYLQISSYYDKSKKEIVYHYDPYYKLENPIRRYHQAVMLLKAIAFLEGRDKVTMEDFRDIRQIFWGIDTKKERKKKLKLIGEFDLPDFEGEGKKYTKFSLFDTVSKKELDRLEGRDKPDQIDLTEHNREDLNEQQEAEYDPTPPDDLNEDPYPHTEDDIPQDFKYTEADRLHNPDEDNEPRESPGIEE